MDWIREKLSYYKRPVKGKDNCGSVVDAEQSIFIHVKLRHTIKEIRGKIRWRRSEIIKLTI